MSPQIEIQIIAVLVAVTCSLPGVFLVLRKMSMMTDSITHTILLGIVLAFFVTHDLSSPFLVVGAALMGVATVWLTELLNKTRLVSEDSAIGIIFPLLFSFAIILINRYAGSVHLDTDSVLLGELAFAPFERLKIAGVDIGAKAIYSSAFLLLLNLVLIIVFFKELKLATFDPVLAAVVGFSPVLLHYGLMTLVSVTAVGVFKAVGSVLVIAFMIGSPSTAYLLTDDLKKMLAISAGVGAVSGLSGYWFACLLDVSIAGSIAVMVGVIFLIVFLFSPRRGLVRILLRKRRQRDEFAQKTLMLHLYHHQDSPEEIQEAGLATIGQHLKWPQQKTQNIIDRLMQKGFVTTANGIVKLTKSGVSQCRAIRQEFSLDFQPVPG